MEKTSKQTKKQNKAKPSNLPKPPNTSYTTPSPPESKNEPAKRKTPRTVKNCCSILIFSFQVYFSIGICISFSRQF